MFCISELRAIKAKSSILNIKENRASAMFAHERMMAKRIETLYALQTKQLSAKDAGIVAMIDMNAVA